MQEKLEELITPTVQSQGVELYDLEYVKEGGSRILRLFIDKDGGVDLNDCERVSRAVSDLLDEKDPIADAYRLQVGSPGIDRRLRKPAHFARFVGSKVTVKLFAPHCPITGRKKFTGTLAAFTGDTVTLTDPLTDPEESYDFELKKISACNIIPQDVLGRNPNNG